MLDEAITVTSQFKPHQIVCLEYQNNFLYGEVIQVIPDRQSCWVRPLFLAIDLDIANPIYEQKLIDVRYIADLIFPLYLFRPALDTEMIPLYTQIGEFNAWNECSQDSRYQLQQFVRQILKNNPKSFKTN